MDNNENSVFLKSIERFSKPTMPLTCWQMPSATVQAPGRLSGQRRAGRGRGWAQTSARRLRSQDHALNISKRWFPGCAKGAAPTWRQRRERSCGAEHLRCDKRPDLNAGHSAMSEFSLSLKDPPSWGALIPREATAGSRELEGPSSSDLSAAPLWLWLLPL